MNALIETCDHVEPGVRKASAPYAHREAEHVAVAVELARGDPEVPTGTACAAASISKGGFWTPIDAWRKTIVTEKLLDTLDCHSTVIDEEAAAEERRAKRAKLERERCAVARDIRATVDGIVESIERRAALEQHARDLRQGARAARARYQTPRGAVGKRRRAFARSLTGWRSIVKNAHGRDALPRPLR